MSKLIKEIMDALTAAQKNKTEPYDRSGEVKRIEGKIAWVKLEGSDRETPIQMTIACDVGDTVQARIGGGSAWLTGNLTAPPTDDKKANQAISMVTTVVQEVQEQVEEVLEDVSTVDDVTMQYCLSDSSSTFVQYGDWSNTPPTYVSGKYYWTRTVLYDEDSNPTYGTPQYSQDTQLSVETDVAFKSNNNHFWHDTSGAYVTTTNKSYSTGSAVRITASGILQQVNGSTVSSWTNSGISFYQGTDSYGSPITAASFGSGGVSLYENGNNVAYLASTLRLGRSDAANIQIPSVTETTTGYHSDINFYYNGTKNGNITSGRNGSTYYTSMMANGGYLTINDTSGSIGVTTNGRLSCGSVSSSGSVSCSSVSSSGSVSCGGISSSGDILAESDNIKGSDMYTKCTLGEGGSATANCRLGATSGGYYRLCLVQGGSSKRYKHDIKPIEEETLDPHRLYDAEVIQFVYNDGYLGKDDCRYNKPLSGFIAEDLREVYPIAVDVEDGKCETWNERYIIPPMLALIQEQNKRIAELEKRVL